MNRTNVAASARQERGRRKYSLRWALLRLAFKLLGTISPRTAARWAQVLWFRPRRYAPPAREHGLLASAICHPMACGGQTISVYTWGMGPVILLVHGWSGRGTQLGAFVTPLVDAGYQVVAFDAPAHGRSSGRDTTLPEISNAILALARKFAPVHAVIAHSFGVPSVLYALQQQCFASRLVALSAPATLEGLMQKFALELGLTAATARILRAMFEQRFGADMWERFSAQSMVKHVAIRGLVIHDRDDHDIPWQEGETLAGAWAGADFITTEGLGHRRLLREPGVVDEVVRFIGPAKRRPALPMERVSTG